jgi:catecholate siderophore receptor
VRLHDFNFKLEGDAALRVNAMTTDSDGDNAGAENPPPRPGAGLPLRHRHRQRVFRSACTHLHYNDKPDGFAWLNGRLPHRPPTSTGMG